MQAGASTDGIQKLLSAEQEAQRIVSEARKGKTERLRQAKAEAEREISAYRQEREAAYQKRVQESSAGATSTAERLDKETADAIRDVQNDVKAKKSQVVDMLVSYATTVKFA